MEESIKEVAKDYAEKVRRSSYIHSMGYGYESKHLIEAFIAGFGYANENKKLSKQTCLRDKNKICNLCHECDVDILNPSY